MRKFIKISDDFAINCEEILYVSGKQIYFKNNKDICLSEWDSSKILIEKLDSISTNDATNCFRIPKGVQRESFNIFIDELDLSIRAKNALKAANISSLGELIKFREADLRKLPNLGRVSLNEIKAVLNDLDLYLAGGK